MSSNFPNIPDSSIPGQLAHVQPPESWIYDRDPANGTARATFNGEVYAQTINSPAAGVSAFNGRTGSVTLDLADVEAAGGAPLASPAFTGNPTVPTQASGTSNNDAASTAFVMQAVQQGAGVVSFNGRSGAVQLTLGDVTSVGGAPLASPALSGSPSAPTPVVTDNSSLLATTAYVNNWGAQNTVLSFNGRRGAVTLTLADVESVGGAPIASPSFTGVPVVPTAAPGTASGQAASCAFVENAITAGVSGVASFNGRAGAVTLTTADVTTAGGAPILSPVLTGTPTAPTAVAGTNSGQLATCAFVETAIGSIAPIVNSFNGRNGTVTLTLGDVTGVGGAPIASPAFTGVPTVPTAAPGTSGTEAASCGFVEAAIASVAGVSSFNTRQGAVTLTGSDITGAGGALLAAPALTGAATLNGSAIATAATLGNYLPLAGGTMTGNINSTASGNFSNSAIGGVQLNSGSVTATQNVTAQNTVFVGTSGQFYLAMPGGAPTVNFAAAHYLQFDGGTFNFTDSIITPGGTINGTLNVSGGMAIGGNITTPDAMLAAQVLPINGNNSGNCGAPGNAWFQVASYNFVQESSGDLKRVEPQAAPGLETLAQINPVRFHWKEGPDQENEHIGFLAEEVNSVLGEGTAPGAQGINTNELVAVLWKAVQEVANVAERLDRSVAEVKATVEELKTASKGW